MNNITINQNNEYKDFIQKINTLNNLINNNSDNKYYIEDDIFNILASLHYHNIKQLIQYNDIKLLINSLTLSINFKCIVSSDLIDYLTNIIDDFNIINLKQNKHDLNNDIINILSDLYCIDDFLVLDAYDDYYYYIEDCYFIDYDYIYNMVDYYLTEDDNNNLDIDYITNYIYDYVQTDCYFNENNIYIIDDDINCYYDEYKDEYSTEYNSINQITNDYHDYNIISLSNSNKTIGFELEFEFIDDINNINTITDLKNHLDDYNIFIPSYDGSLNYPSIELVSNILDLNIILDNKQYFDKLFNIISPFFDNCFNCGMHIHINRNSIDNNTLKNLIKFIENNNKLFVLLSGRHNTIKCLNNLEFDHKTYWNNSKKMTKTNRYLILNQINDDTLEFRFFNTSKNYNSILRRILFIYALISSIKSNNIYFDDYYIIDDIIKNLEYYSKKYNLSFDWYINKIKAYKQFKKEYNY